VSAQRQHAPLERLRGMGEEYFTKLKDKYKEMYS